MCGRSKSALPGSVQSDDEESGTDWVVNQETKSSRNQTRHVGARQKHAVDGMPRCSMCGHKFLRLLLNIRCKRQGLTLTMAGQALEPEAEFMEFFGATMPALRDTVAKRAADLSSQTGPNKRPHLEAPKQGKGKGWGKGSRNNGGWGNRIQHSTPTQAAFTLSSDDLQHMMHIMARLLVQQDNEIQMIKMDKQFLLHFETRPQGMVHMFWESAQVWKQAKAEQPPKVDKSLMVTLLLCMMMELEARLDKLSWPYMVWTGEKLELDNNKAAIPHDDVMEIIREIKKNLLDKTEELVHKFHSGLPLAEQMEGDTLPFLLSISTRGALADRTFELFRMLEGNTVLRIVGARLRGERLRRQPLVNQLVDAIQLQLSK
ncbi:unnamed protein product [Symbiodinium microadriaticum]|nr:unnamed protein product [Symbiodinium microadriaticum]CAE7745212.1 unnamed protein product [Symbiodinium sp. KB8]